MKVVENKLPVLRNILGVYHQKDIYNMDEVVVCTNANGTDKVPLWFISKHVHLCGV